MGIRVQAREVPPPAIPNPSTDLSGASLRYGRASGLEETLTLGVRLRRPAASAFTLSLSLSIVTAPPVQAQEENETPSIGWEFEPQGSGPTSWRGVSIQAAEDDDDDDELIVFRHEVRNENSECPDFLHPDNLPVEGEDHRQRPRGKPAQTVDRGHLGRGG